MIESAPFLGMRRQMRAFTESLDESQAFGILEGFNNNIAWHLGHIAITQQILCYELCGLEPIASAETLSMYRKGTSPKDWQTNPILESIAHMLTDLAERFVEDWKKEIFKSFSPYTTSAGVQLNRLEEAFVFNHIHEGMHFGQVRLMLRLASQS